MVYTRRNLTGTTPTVSEKAVKRRKNSRSDNDTIKQREIDSPGETDKNEVSDMRQMMDGNMGKEVTVDSMPSVSECTMKIPSEFGSGDTTQSVNDKEKIARKKKHIERCVKTQLMTHVRDYWYESRKFVTKIEDEHMIMNLACHDEPSIVPADGFNSRDEFVKKFTPMVKKCMSQLRRNSQLLAKQHHSGELDSCL